MLGNALRWMNRSLFQVSVLNTTMCNAGCPYCCSAGILNQPKGEFTLEEWRKISEKLPHFPWLTISGGEPFTKRDVKETVSLFIEGNKVEYASIITNGYYSDRIVPAAKELAQRYPDTRIGISISVDDLGERHDEVRRVKGNFERILKTFHALKEAQSELPNLSLKFNTVVTVFNYQRIDEIMAGIRTLDPDMHTMNFIRRTWDSGEVKFPPEEELPGIFDKISRYYDTYGARAYTDEEGGLMAVKKQLSRLVDFNRSRVSLQRQYIQLIPETLKQKTQVIPCYAYDLSLFIYPKGDVAFCDILKPFANIKDFDYDYGKLMQSEVAKKTAAFIHNKGCWCYSPCVQYMNLVHNPKTVFRAAKYLVSS